MGAFQHLLRRWGLVRLDRYGLALTPEGRILSTRPEVLDDGAGGRIVGWQDADLAVGELQPWERRPGSDSARPPAVAPVIPPSPGPGASAPGCVTPPATFASGVVMPLAVARDAAVDEDDWEWTIALARARAAAEEIEASVRPPDPGPPRSVTRSMPTVAMKPPARPAESVSVDYEDDSRITTRPAIPVPPAAPPMPRATAPVTVIPVPPLPTIHGQAARFEPVVRTTASPAAPSRFPKGTAPHDPESNLTVGDQTTPGIAMPLPARAVALPSTKGRGTKGRSATPR